MYPRRLSGSRRGASAQPRAGASVRSRLPQSPESSLDLILLLKAAIMGVVEGLTEFLPVSSAGHLILTGSLLGFHDDKMKVFDIAIQTGAIVAVIIVYWQRL